MFMKRTMLIRNITTDLSLLGSLARIGPNDVITTDISHVHRIQAARSPYCRSNWYCGFRLAPGVDNVLSQTDDNLHAKRRALLSPGCSPNYQEIIVDSHVAKLVTLIRTKYLSNEKESKSMDSAQKVQFFALNAVMDIATGSPFQDLVHDKDRYEYLKSTADHTCRSDDTLCTMGREDIAEQMDCNTDSSHCFRVWDWQDC